MKEHGLLLRLVWVLRVMDWALWNLRSVVSRLRMRPCHCRYVRFREACSSRIPQGFHPCGLYSHDQGLYSSALLLRFTLFG